jgi:hypothetical protein
VSTHLSEHFKKRRLEKGLRLSELARLLGYSNLSKGCQRIETFEGCGDITSDLFAKLALALEIDQLTIDRLAQEDLREWAAWANEPIKPYMVVRAMATVYCPVNLPDEIQSVEEAQAFASKRAREWSKRICLILSRRISVWYAADGTVEQITEAVPGGGPNQPYTEIGGKRCLMRPVGQGIVLEQVKWYAKSFPGKGK